MDLDGREDGESGWLPLQAERFLKARWDEEKEVFMATPRRPDWKDAKWSEAKKQQRGGIVLLLDHINAKHLAHEQVTVALWRHLQSLTIAVEGELRTSDGRLMGRLDLLFADVDEAGEMQGWLVADLKTGNAPTKALKPEVNRQLRMYRDIILANNPAAPPSVPKGGTPRPPQSGQRKERACLNRLTLRGKRPSLRRCRWHQPLAPTVAADFAIGKPGVRTGGPGGSHPAPCTKVIFAMRWCCCIATRNLLGPLCSSCASLWMRQGARFQRATNALLALTVVEKRCSKRFKKPGIKGRCSLVRS